MTEPVRDGSERLVMFTDAVAAIALTLLILPLLETISDVEPTATAADLVRDHIGQFGAFAFSFAVIFRFWWAHHRIFGHISRLNVQLVQYSTLWTFGVVLLPIPTAIITAVHPSPASVALYGGALVLVTGSMSMIALTAFRHPEVSEGRTPVPREALLGTVTVFGAQVVATIVGSVFADSINFWAFLLMFLVGPVERLIKARWRKADQPVAS